jgi:diguanylate cyclase (GGDEF)-like protein
VLLVILSLCGIGAFTLETRHDVIDDSLRETDRVADMLAEQVEVSLSEIDEASAQIQRAVRRRPSEDGQSFADFVLSERFQTSLILNASRLPKVEAIGIFDADGVAIDGTWTQAQQMPVSVGDRAYFHELRDDPTDRLVISMPVESRVSGKQIVVLGRRLSDETGKFLGVVLTAIPTTYFENAYYPIRTIDTMNLLLLRSNGVMLARFPDPVPRAGQQLPADSPWYGIARTGGHYWSPGYFDANARLVSVRPLKSYPLVINISIPEAVALKRYWDRSTYNIAGAGALVVAVVLLLGALLRQLQRLTVSEEAAREAKAAAEDKSRQLFVANMRLDAALENMQQGICMFDGEQRLIIANSRMSAIYGLDEDFGRPGTRWIDIVTALVQKGILEGGAPEEWMSRIPESEVQHHHLPDGRVIQVRIHRLKDGGWMATHFDITDRYHKDQQIAFMACHDMLTGLLNRAAFAEKIEEAAARSRRRGDAFNVLMLDLDRFKQVNDTLGHPAGDALLIETAQRLKRTLRETDALARLGGDEFAILQDGITDPEKDGAGLALRIIACLAAPFDIEGQTVSVGASIGIAVAPQHGMRAKDLLKRADLALYRAKARGRRCFTVFDAGLENEAESRRTLELELRRALAGDELTLHYQPLVDLRSGRRCGAEALVRWQHPERGLLLPREFIPIAEETGLIVELGRWVLKRACRDAAGWPADTMVAVNLSPLQFLRGDLLATIGESLGKSGLRPERLELEITEAILLDAEAATCDLMQRIKDLGVSMALDDFGTGYASLSYLTMFPFDRIKIDRSFTAKLDQSKCAAVVASTVTLARGLDMSVTAEGVETDRQFRLLKAAGVDTCQGYLLGRPGPMEHLGLDDDTAERRKARA